MLIEKKHNSVFQLTLSGYELAALVSSARWITDGAKGEFTDDAKNHLKQVLSNYDKATGRAIKMTPKKTRFK